MIWQNIFHLFLFYGRPILFSSKKVVVEMEMKTRANSFQQLSVEVNLLALCQNKKIPKNLNVNEKRRKKQFFPILLTRSSDECKAALICFEDVICHLSKMKMFEWDVRDVIIG